MSRENRKKLDNFEQSKTDQSFRNVCDVNVIVKKYHRTGIMPKFEHYNGKYGDFSEIPTLEEAFEAVKRAEESFMALPADVRKLMDNDPSQLEIWLSKAENRNIAEIHGLLEKREESSDHLSSGGVKDESINANSNGGSDASSNS